MLRRATVLLAVPAALVAAAAPAQAKGPVVELAGAQDFGGQQVMLSGRKLAVRATAPGAQPGSKVQITWTVNGKRARRSTQPLADGAEAFDSLKVELPGAVTMSAKLLGPDAQDAGTAPVQRVRAILPFAKPGDTGLGVRFLQNKLQTIGFTVPASGRFDVKTEFAVIAFHKVNGQSRTSTADRRVFAAVAAGRGAYQARFPKEGRHVEFDRQRQVLALVESGGRVVRVYHSSSGRPRFRTPLGNFRFYRKEPGLNDRGMLDSVYYTHEKTTSPTRPACAVHGYFAVPTFPNSHCCLRVGEWDARKIYNWIHLGERVHIYV
jgi:L,D-transpeptidase catalytic domain